MMKKKFIPKKVKPQDFDRWGTVEISTWTAQVYKRYNDELERYLNSQIYAKKFVYNQLGVNEISLKDKTKEVFDTKDTYVKKLKTVEMWSKSYNKSENWLNLNALMSISSNFETYLDGVIRLAIKSDPGLLLGQSRSVDGVNILKNGNYKLLNIDDILVGITKGTWSARMSNIESVFGFLPTTLSSSIGKLDAIRILRNDVGHAFGRGIEASRIHHTKNVLEIQTLSRNRLLKFQRLLWAIVRDFDEFLYKNHIGAFQYLYSYHEFYPTVADQNHVNARAALFKQYVGQSGSIPIGKKYYKDLCSFYEKI